MLCYPKDGEQFRARVGEGFVEVASGAFLDWHRRGKRVQPFGLALTKTIMTAMSLRRIQIEPSVSFSPVWLFDLTLVLRYSLHLCIRP